MSENILHGYNTINNSNVKLTPCTGIPAESSKRTPTIGSCIGVLYECGNKNPNTSFCKECGSTVYCVHNGRLIADTKNYILVNHYKLDSAGSPKEETRIFYKYQRYPHVVDYKVTPDLPKTDPRYCKDFRSKSIPGIIPSNAVGIEFYKDPVKKIKDIKNGRYVFWLESDETRHCVINNANMSKVFRVYYYHYKKPSCNPSGGIPRLEAELTCKDNVIWVFKLTKKDHKFVEKC
ncbi:hypothetical protein [Clostridium paridis]|uniref:Uncharacterized protein n=1 Tax=Clostridium paridis TaxID=2803863 RepID=A0A937FH91_9CLOT|nr:hypothetical protein [Clostridium paridis]MBL4931942.1 hypothetical protein [Clostridium paridis]